MNFKYDKVILIDDDPINNLINRKIFSKTVPDVHIFEFLEGKNALQFLESAESIENTLVLLDINMPIMNGWDFLDIFTSKGYRLDVWMLSSSIDPRDEVKSHTYPSVKGFIGKPLSQDKIKDTFF
ncbi:response regulator [Penaeicola halotolerans]|uniref:response regulator n=1 Tax=Penaeicola halotolerans TaxID=2793196 RepID=UPI001CF919CC|nr:response regulator [Penaeicola halotolerans]